MSKLKTLRNLIESGKDLKGRKVLLRADLNVPMHQGKVSDLTRITSIVPTILALIKSQAKIIILSHFGRPDGKFVRDMTLAPIADALSSVLGGKEVKFGLDCVGPLAAKAVSKLKNGEILMLENLRFHKNEEENDKSFSKEIAGLGDIFVNDAFSCSHRAHASITGVTEHLDSYAGFLFEDEIKHLESVLNKPKRPVAAIVGGSKVSTKIDLLSNLVKKMDFLFIGGGMANTFLYALGKKVGNSLYEKDYKKTALSIIKEADKSGCRIMLPTDAVVACELKSNPECEIVSVDSVGKNQMILDIGPETKIEWSNKLLDCRTIVWNGPLGAFEYSPFDVGTIGVARVVASLTKSGKTMSVAGGGDTIAVLSKAGLLKNFSYISTAGGAFLEWLEGRELPGVKVLMK